MAALTPNTQKYNEMMAELLVKVKKNTVLVLIAIVFVGLDMRYLHLSRHGGMNGFRQRVGSNVFMLEHVLQEFLYKKQCAMIDFLLGTMCMSLGTVVSGICYTSAFTSPVPDATIMFKLLLSSTLYAVLKWCGHSMCDVLFAVFFVWMYRNNQKWTVGNVVLPVGLQLILCNDILQQDCHTLVRYIVLYFFVCRLLEIAPIVVKYWQIGICFKDIILALCRDILTFLTKTYTTWVAFVELCVKYYGSAKVVYQAIAAAMSSSDIRVINNPFADDRLGIRVKHEDRDDDVFVMPATKIVNTGYTGRRTRHMYKQGASPDRPI
jgi:hypothetical protein